MDPGLPDGRFGSYMKNDQPFVGILVPEHAKGASPFAGDVRVARAEVFLLPSQWELFYVIVPPLPDENSTMKLSMRGATAIVFLL